MPMAATSSTELIAARLQHQQLVRSSKRDPAEVVAWLGAMQAQDFSGAKWAIGMRAPACHESSIDEAFNAGSILRTHVLRPTWHFVAAADIKWLLALSAPRVLANNAYYYQQLGLDKKVFDRSCAMMSRVLDGGEFKTRAELAIALKRAKVPADGLKLAYIMMHAELEGVITSGPRRGKQFTYALLDERAPKARELDRDEALAELVKRYFTSHGPATIRDFVWWSGLTAKDAEAGIEAVKPKLHQETIDGRVYWGTPSRSIAAAKGCIAHLLPNYDEYLIAYKDRSAALDPGLWLRITESDRFAAPVVLDGRVVGGWKRTMDDDDVSIVLDLPGRLGRTDTRLVEDAARRYGDFLGLEVVISRAATTTRRLARRSSHRGR